MAHRAGAGARRVRRAGEDRQRCRPAEAGVHGRADRRPHTRAGRLPVLLATWLLTSENSGMPSGGYLHEDGTLERFSCAPDGGGWRYHGRRSDGGTIELVADGLWRPARLELTAGDRVLRGGAVGPDLLWVTGGQEHSARA